MKQNANQEDSSNNRYASVSNQDKNIYQYTIDQTN